MRNVAWAIALAVALAGVGACESSAGTDAGDAVAPDVPSDPGTDPGPDVPVVDPGPRDPGEDPAPVDVPADLPQDVPVVDPGPADLPSDPGTDPGADVPPVPGPCGFQLRVPATLAVPFEAMPGGEASTQDMPQIDHVCTFRHGGHEGCLYVQATPTGCAGMTGCTYRTDAFWTSFDGNVEPVAGASYDYGGNHHNDSVTFPLFGKTYRTYHSTFGWGWRQCQPMDCLMVYATEGMVLEEDGCVCGQRTLPIECVIVKADGTVDPFPATFEPCAGPGCS